MGRNVRRIVLALLAVVVITYGAIWAKFAWDFRRIHVAVALESAGAVDEQQAVHTTRRALQLAGVSTEGFRPVPYGSSPALFARNQALPNEGYVLWVGARATGVWDYLVRCEWRPSVADCFVSRAD